MPPNTPHSHQSAGTPSAWSTPPTAPSNRAIPNASTPSVPASPWSRPTPAPSGPAWTKPPTASAWSSVAALPAGFRERIGGKGAKGTEASPAPAGPRAPSSSASTLAGNKAARAELPAKSADSAASGIATLPTARKALPSPLSKPGIPPSMLLNAKTSDFVPANMGASSGSGHTASPEQPSLSRSGLSDVPFAHGSGGVTDAGAGKTYNANDAAGSGATAGTGDNPALRDPVCHALADSDTVDRRWNPTADDTLGSSLSASTTASTDDLAAQRKAAMSQLAHLAPAHYAQRQKCTDDLQKIMSELEIRLAGEVTSYEQGEHRNVRDSFRRLADRVGTVQGLTKSVTAPDHSDIVAKVFDASDARIIGHQICHLESRGLLSLDDRLIQHQPLRSRVADVLLDARKGEYDDTTNERAYTGLRSLLRIKEQQYDLASRSQWCRDQLESIAVSAEESVRTEAGGDLSTTRAVQVSRAGFERALKATWLLLESMGLGTINSQRKSRLARRRASNTTEFSKLAPLRWAKTLGVPLSADVADNRLLRDLVNHALRLASSIYGDSALTAAFSAGGSSEVLPREATGRALSALDKGLGMERDGLYHNKSCIKSSYLDTRMLEEQPVDGERASVAVQSLVSLSRALEVLEEDGDTA